jgi:hypothetical protein
MIDRYGLVVKPNVPTQKLTRGAFINFGYNECVDSVAGFGIFRLACDARVLPGALTSLFQRVIEEEARHIVFFVNWVAWDRTRRGLRGPVLQAVPSLYSYAAAIGRRIKGGAELQSGKSEEQPLDLFGDLLKGLTLERFLRACVNENDRYMAAFDPRLIRPRVIPALARVAIAIVEAIDFLQAAWNKAERRSPT